MGQFFPNDPEVLAEQARLDMIDELTETTFQAQNSAFQAQRIAAREQIARVKTNAEALQTQRELEALRNQFDSMSSRRSRRTSRANSAVPPLIPEVQIVSVTHHNAGQETLNVPAETQTAKELSAPTEQPPVMRPEIGSLAQYVQQAEKVPQNQLDDLAWNRATVPVHFLQQEHLQRIKENFGANEPMVAPMIPQAVMAAPMVVLGYKKILSNIKNLLLLQ